MGLVTGVSGDRTPPDSKDDRQVSLVWLDSREAIIVRWDGSTTTIDQMASDVPARHRATGHERHHPDARYGAGFGHPHSTGEPRRLEHLARFVDRVASRLSVDDDLILIGPGTVHEQLARRIGELDARHAIRRSVQSESAPPMTRRQLAARVRRAAGHEPRRRTVGAYRWSSDDSATEMAPHLPRRVSTKRPSHRALAARRVRVMRVLVGTDGSAASGVALDLVAGAGWPPESTVRVLEAIDPGAGLLSGPWPSVSAVEADGLESTLRQAATENVNTACDRLARPELQVTSAVVHGRPSTAIADTARDLKADVIVVGSRGHGTIASMLLGSVSAEVVDQAPVPVIVARGTSLQRVVLAWDGSDSARAAADLLRTWDVFAGSVIRVVSVADVEPQWWTGFPEMSTPQAMTFYVDAAAASRRTHDNLAGEMAAELRAAGRDASAERRDGNPASAIIAAARESTADLIVLGTHGRTGLSRLVLGSVARNVLLHAPCSVLICRAHPGPA